VIYQESKFDSDARSPSGAVGLMQLLPDTAIGIAQRTGGSRFRVEDLLDPEINVRYGSWYLRHLLDKYDGREVPALAAYNAGQGNVDKWLAAAPGERLRPTDIPYAETRHYVAKVLDARDDYRREYASELGL
jgi:soluble lytic murein transglycosylase